MARGISAAAQEAVNAGELYTSYFVEAEFDSGTVRRWTGWGDVQMGGETYSGAGELLKITFPSENNSLTPSPFSVSMAGFDNDDLVRVLAEPYKGRLLTIYEGYATTRAAVPLNASIAARGFMDVANIDRGPDTSTIPIQCENRLMELLQVDERRYTSAQQNVEHPNDRIFDGVPGIEDLRVDWGE